MTSDVPERWSGSDPRGAAATSFVACHENDYGLTAGQRCGDLGHINIATSVPRGMTEIMQP